MIDLTEYGVREMIDPLWPNRHFMPLIHYSVKAEDFHGHDVIVGGGFVVWLNAEKGPQIGYRVGLAYRDTVDMQHFEYTERVLDHGAVGVEEFEDDWCPVCAQENLYDMECLIGEDQEMPSEYEIYLLRLAWAKDIQIAIQELLGWEDYGDTD